MKKTNTKKVEIFKPRLTIFSKSREERNLVVDEEENLVVDEEENSVLDEERNLV